MYKMTIKMVMDKLTGEIAVTTDTNNVEDLFDLMDTLTVTPIKYFGYGSGCIITMVSFDHKCFCFKDYNNLVDKVIAHDYELIPTEYTEYHDRIAWEYIPV